MCVCVCIYSVNSHTHVCNSMEAYVYTYIHTYIRGYNYSELPSIILISEFRL